MLTYRHEPGADLMVRSMVREFTDRLRRREQLSTALEIVVSNARVYRAPNGRQCHCVFARPSHDPYSRYVARIFVAGGSIGDLKARGMTRGQAVTHLRALLIEEVARYQTWTSRGNADLVDDAETGAAFNRQRLIDRLNRPWFTELVPRSKPHPTLNETFAQQGRAR